MIGWTAWISVDKAMPEERIRVWASDGPMDVGHDCFYGKKGCTLQEAGEKGFWDFGEVEWRRTETDQPVPRPIRYWTLLPDPPIESEATS